jgi:protein-disulfide isomerase
MKMFLTGDRKTRVGFAVIKAKIIQNKNPHYFFVHYIFSKKNLASFQVQ